MKPPKVSGVSINPPTPPLSPASVSQIKPDMRALRHKVHRLLPSRRSSNLKEAIPAESSVDPATPRLEDRPTRRDDVGIAEDATRMPDRPRALPTRLRMSPVPAKEKGIVEEDDDDALEPSSSSSSSEKSRRSGEPISSESSASRSGSSHRDIQRYGAGIFAIERRRAGIPEAAKEAAQELSRCLGEANSGQAAKQAVRTVGEFAFATTEPMGLLTRQDALDEAGVFQRLADVTGRYMSEASVLILSFSILGGLRIDEGVGLRADMMQTVENVVSGLRTYRADGLMVREGLRALCGLTRLDDVRTRILTRCGAIETVVECLHRHVEDEVVQTEGARFLSYASMHSETNKTALAKGGGLGRVLSAAREFGENRVLCTHVCVGLRNVTVSRPDIVGIAEGLDGVAGMLEIMNAHGGCYVTSTHALAALFHMTSKDGAATREVLRHGRWETLLVDTLQHHSGRAGAQALGLAVMERVAKEGGMIASRRLVRAGAVVLALSGMHRFVNKKAVLFFGARLVRRLLETGGGMEEVRAWGGAERLLDLLYCTVATTGSTNDRYSGYADVFSDV